MTFRHSRIGLVEVTFRKNTSRISARWRNGVAVFSFPESVSAREVPGYIERMADALMSRRSDVSFTDKQEIKLDGFTFVISRQSHRPKDVWVTVKGAAAYIEVGSALDMDSLDTTQRISRIMCNIAREVAAGILLPRAREIAECLGAFPRSWSIMSGFRTMGKCSSQGDIHLSYICLFLTLELRDYIVCHELAHLKEMSHSPRFHSICNAYCNGREKELVRKLNNYAWPVLWR